MKTQNRITLVFALAVAAIAVFAGPAQALEGQLGILTNETLSSNNPATGAPWAVGDQYRLAFHTSEGTAATSADIATYNAWAQSLADASPLNIGADEGAVWKVIGSTTTVDARDNTGTNPNLDGRGCAIFLLDGSTLVANDYYDLWDGEIQNPIGITELGTAWTHWPWSGTRTDGTAGTGGSSGNPLGSGGEVGQGNASSTTDWIWRVWTMDPPANEMPMYALSDPLVIVGEVDANIPNVDAGADMVAWSGRAVQLDPDIVEKEGSNWTNLVYIWTADPDEGVVFSNPNILAPTITIIKATDNPSVVTLTLAVNNARRTEPPVTDTMTIDVYDNSCLAAIDLGLAVFDSTDFNRDCITNFEDLALMAATWLDDYALTEPEPK